MVVVPCGGCLGCCYSRHFKNQHEHGPHLPSASPSQQKGGDGATVTSLWTLRKELLPTGCRMRLSCPHRKTHCSVHIRKLGYPRTTLTPLLLPIFSEWKRQASVMLHPPPTLPPAPRQPYLQKRFLLLSQSSSQYLGSTGWGGQLGWRKTGKLFTVSPLSLKHKGGRQS